MKGTTRIYCHTYFMCQMDTTSAGYGAALANHCATTVSLGDRVRHNSSRDVRCKKNPFSFFFTSNLSKEHMQSNTFLNEHSSAYTKLQQRAPQNHRTGFIIGRTVQAQTRKTENDWAYAGGKKQTNTIPQGPCVATLRGSLVCHSFQDHTKIYSLSSLLALKTCQCLISSLLLVFSSVPFLAVPSHLNGFSVSLHQS